MARFQGYFDFFCSTDITKLSKERSSLEMQPFLWNVFVETDANLGLGERKQDHFRCDNEWRQGSVKKRYSPNK